MSLHLGILQTDSVLPDFVDTHGDYPHMFRGLFSAVDADVRFTDYDVQVAPPTDLSCDAYVITGSKRSVYEELEWINALVGYVEEVLAARKKIIGVCFGHQLMAHHFGGRVEAADAGWAVGVHHSRVVSAQPWMGADTGEVGLLSSHKDQVVELPEGADVYLSSDFCPIAGFTMGDQVITVQGHPEFDKDYASELMHMRRDILGEVVFTRGIESLAHPTREHVVARWMLDFAAGRAT